jgi:hypothetical protein
MWPGKWPSTFCGVIDSSQGVYDSAITSNEAGRSEPGARITENCGLLDEKGLAPFHQTGVGREVSSSRLPKIYRVASCEMNCAGPPPGKKKRSAPAKKRFSQT